MIMNVGLLDLSPVSPTPFSPVSRFTKQRLLVVQVDAPIGGHPTRVDIASSRDVVQRNPGRYRKKRSPQNAPASSKLQSCSIAMIFRQSVLNMKSLTIWVFALCVCSQASPAGAETWVGQQRNSATSPERLEAKLTVKDGTAADVCNKKGMGSPQNFQAVTADDILAKLNWSLAYNWWRTFTGKITQAVLNAEVANGRLTAAVAASLSGMVGSCGGATNSAVGNSAPIVSVTITAPAQTQQNVATSQPLTATFTIANGTYVSHAITANCNGSVATQGQQLTAGVTTGTITATPVTSWTAGQPCTFRVTVNATGGVSSFAEVTASMASLPVPKLLFMGTASPVNNGGVPISVINAATGTISELTQFTNQVTLFDGFCYNPVSRNVHMHARANFSGVADPQGNIRFPVYNLDTRVVSAGPSLGDETSVRAPVACTANGTVFYGRGIILGTGASSGRLEVVEGGVRTATIALDQAGNRIPARIAVGATEVYVLNQAPTGLASSFSVVNISTKTLTRTCAIGSEAFDMDVANGTAYVSVFRDASSSQKDVLLFNTTTCAQTGSLATSNAGTSRELYVYGIRVGTSGLYVASQEGVRLYSLPALVQTAFFAKPTGTFFAYELTLGSTELYVTFPDDTIAVLNLNLTPIRIITKNVGAGRIYATN